jgi:deoxyadenosine/deoxycytidine kinase
MNTKIDSKFIYKYSYKLDKMCTIINIEGNIGCGKSTFIARLKEEFKDNNQICILPEPVEEWLKIRDSEGNILQHYYKDQKAYAFSFQMLAYISRLAILKEAIDWGYKYIITERCLETDKHIFCQMLYDDGFINPIEFQIYNKWFDAFITKHVYKTIYLRCEPCIAHERVKIRSRMEETISLDYLQKCHNYHDKWMHQIWGEDRSCITIDANVDMNLNPETIQEWVDIVKKIVRYDYVDL